MKHADVIVIGGGFYGCSLAIWLAQRGYRVVLLERESDLMQQASLKNQARVHNGYHYPRHFMTAVRSHQNYMLFIERFSDCIASSIPSYYAIARHFSKIDSDQFIRFFANVGSELKPAPEAVRSLFDNDMITDVFAVDEVVFDAKKLSLRIKQELKSFHVAVRTSVSIESIHLSAATAQVHDSQGEVITGDHILNCTYASLNDVLALAALPMLPLKLEMTEMALIRPPQEIADLGITVMCGPFFSTLPYPPRPGHHTLSHVLYTPHYSWSSPTQQADLRSSGVELLSAFPHMVADAKRYVPSLAKALQVDSIWALKAVRPSNEGNDGRPILVHQAHPRLTSVLGGKIDNIFDIQLELESTFTSIGAS